MTAIVAVTGPTRVDVLCDGAVYLPDGTLLDVMSKVWPLAGMRACVGGRGLAVMPPAFLIRAGWMVPTFDALVAHFAEILTELERTMRPRVGDAFDHHELVLAGWSESRDRGEVYFEQGHAEPRRVLRECTEVLVLGPDPDKHWAALQGKAAQFDPERDGLPIFEEMRARRMTLDATRPEAAEGHGVGGFVDVTTITRDGLSKRILHRWPEDRVGEKIAA